MSKENTERKSFYVISKYATGVTAKWMFSPGAGLAQEPDEEEEEDFCWEKQTTVSTAPVDFDDDSSIMFEDEFAEDLVEDVKELYHAAVKTEECVLAPTPAYKALLEKSYKEFKEISASPAIRRTTLPAIGSARLTHSSHRRSSHGRRRKYTSERRASDPHNRDLIRSSMKNLLDL